VDDYHVPLSTECCESKDRDAEGQRDGELVQLADDVAERPRVECVYHRLERHRDQYQQEVTRSQADQQDVGFRKKTEFVKIFDYKPDISNAFYTVSLD